MQYPALKYVPQAADPSITIETAELVAKIIDNTGLELREVPGYVPHFGRYGLGHHLATTHHLGYHGIRSFYRKDEKRNLVVRWASWLNLQAVRVAGIENDPVDERAAYGVGRGWPVRIERKDEGVVLTIDPMPETQFEYTIEFRPAEPDGIDFAVRFTFHRKPDNTPARFYASWPCYMNAYDDVRFHYPKGTPDRWQWAHIGEKPDAVIGDPVGYEHRQESYHAEDQAMPVGYGLIGERALTLMLSDPSVTFFVVNAGGHAADSPVQNPAWDFSWEIDDYPLDEPVGFDGRLTYARFEGPDQVMERYRQWKGLQESARGK